MIKTFKEFLAEEKLRLIEGPMIGDRIVPRLANGKKPDYLYRVMSMKEYENGVNSGKFIHKERIHASATPNLQYAEPGNNNVLVKIKYDDADGWKAKLTLNDVVAVTDKAIQSNKVEMVAKGSRNELKENIDIPINIGDTILGGRFKNKRIVVKTIDKNEKGDILINGKPLLKYRLIDNGEQNE